MTPQRTVCLDGNDPEIKRIELLNYFQQTYQLDEDLYSVLNCNQAYYKIADTLRHPLIFYLAHTATFYINKLILMNIIQQRINPAFEELFAVGVDEMSWDHLNTENYAWPSVEDVSTYRKLVYETVIDVIKNIPLTLPIRWDDPAWILLMGIEHERIHFETSSVLIRQLPIEMVTPNAQWPRCTISSQPENNRLIAVNQQAIELGKSTTARFYGWDNEYGKNNFLVNDFYASKFLVSNAEYLAFINNAGYSTKHYWTSEGWAWLTYMQAKMPRFWQYINNRYYLRLMTEIIEMPWDWPVEVNHLEAHAFCQWLSETTKQDIRLPTEAEWYVLRNRIKEQYPDWNKPIGNIDLAYFASPCPINYFKQGEFYDIVGNVWQWTDTTFSPYNGFKPHAAYDDFSTPTFYGRHNMIKGGSWISTGNLAINESRYAFRRHFYQHAGFRYVKS